jgi:hypothetical protein
VKCRICDASLPEVQFNSEHGDIDPCPSCLFVIQDTLDGFKDNAAPDEDAFGEENPLRALVPFKDYDFDLEQACALFN